MGAPGFRPVPSVNPDEWERPGPNIPNPGWTRRESTRPFNVGPLRRSNETQDDKRETTAVDADSLQAVDLADFRMWWQRGFAQEVAEGRSQGWKLTPMALVLAGIAITGSIFALKGGTLSVLNGPPMVPSAHDTARTQTPSGETASTPADVSAMSSTELATAVAPKVVAPLASPAPMQSPDPNPVSARPDATLIAAELPSAAQPDEASSSPDVPRPPAKSAPEGTNSAVATARPSSDLPTKRPGKITTRIVVATTEGAAPIAATDTPIPPLPIGTPVKPEEAGGAKDLQPIPEFVAAPAAPAEAAKQPVNSLRQALGDLFGSQSSRTQRAVDPTTTGSTGSAVQLTAAKSKAEAKRVLRRLNAKYGSALKGSTIRLQKARVDGETVYRLHVVGLSRDEAAALCLRVKSNGGSCLIVR
jgi:SPOR domain